MQRPKDKWMQALSDWDFQKVQTYWAESNISAKVEAQTKAASNARIWVSLPLIPEAVTRSLGDATDAGKVRIVHREMDRLEGLVDYNQFGWPFNSRIVLYAQGVFEGQGVFDQVLFRAKEHIGRLYYSAQEMFLPIPMSPTETAHKWVGVAHAIPGVRGGAAYLRPIIGGGEGPLGLGVGKTTPPIIGIEGTTIQLYPQEKYDEGLHVAVSKHVNQADMRNFPPNMKTVAYMHRMIAQYKAMQEQATRGVDELLLLTYAGDVAEFLVDNVIVLDLKKKTAMTPYNDCVLPGITRDENLDILKTEMGFTILDEDSGYSHFTIDDMVGPDKIVVMTGTGARVAQAITLDGQQLGTGQVHDVYRELKGRYDNRLATAVDMNRGIHIDATPKEIADYMRME